MVTIADIMTVFEIAYHAFADPLFLFICVAITVALMYHIRHLFLGDYR